ncbi:MAG: prepilin-type N-terminal cleavage/methylation domain-containing protein [Candidatus Latescibacterota bacterium]
MIEQSNRGFTLIEVVVVLAIMGILAGVLIPSVFRQIERARETATQEEVEYIHRAIVGDPKAKNYGYLGDAGSLPATLSDLLTQPVGIPLHSDSTNGIPNKHGVRRGWRGPYLNLRYNDLLDAWGTPYRYGQPPDGAGRIRSAGQDKTFDNTDDIVFPLHAVVTEGTLLAAVFVNGIPNPQDTWVTVYSTADGQQDSVGTQSTNDVGFDGFAFTIPQGIQVVEVTQTSQVKGVGGGTIPTSVTQWVNAAVPANSQVNIEIYLTNSEPVVP